VHCLRKCLKHNKHHKNKFEAVEGLSFNNYDIYSAIKSEEDENTTGIAIDISIQSRHYY